MCEKDIFNEEEFVKILKNSIIPIMPESLVFDENINKVKKCEEKDVKYNKLINYNKNEGKLTIVSSKRSPLLFIEFIIGKNKNYSFTLAENILQEYIKIFREHSPLLKESSHYYDSITESIYIAGISKWLCGDKKGSITFTDILSKIESWKNKKYEGANVTFGFILDLENTEKTEKDIDYIKFLSYDFSGLFANGISTTVYINKEGILLNSCIISEKFAESTLDKDKIIAPKKYLEFAGLISSKKIGIVLENNGDILIFKNLSLFFAKRNGKWIFFDNNKIRQKIFDIVHQKTDEENKTVNEKETILIRSVLNLILDASFKRKGACLGIIDNFEQVKQHAFIDYISFEEYRAGKYSVNNANYSEKEKNINFKKAAITNYMWIDGDKKIQDISRDIITEILSIDGATIINKEGKIVAVGAILNNIEESSEGGARTLAAKTLGNVGLGIKISEDGYVVAYKKDGSEVKEYFNIK